jgi:large subunit ribosomal protein L33
MRKTWRCALWRQALGAARYRTIEVANQMAKKGNRLVVKLRSTESGHMYITYKNRRNDPQRLELKKYDPLLRKHVLYRETK